MLNNENYGYLVHPLSQFMDDNLKPLTSAYLKVFYAGTSKSAYTYSDWEGTLNTSNIMLSMNGSANVIAEKNKAYKVMLCDALHPPSNPIWVKDNLYVISSEIEVLIEESLSETIEHIIEVLIEESLSETIEHILDLSTLGEENTTFNVVLTANRNNAISFEGSSEQTATVAIEIEDDKPYHIQIDGACTLAITGIEWWGYAITDITNKSEINIMNGRAIGVLIDV
jgi:S-ribosylhomocysteine lyase LuxS involved in autoinducer biosynthesis